MACRGTSLGSAAAATWSTVTTPAGTVFGGAAGDLTGVHAPEQVARRELRR